MAYGGAPASTSPLAASSCRVFTTMEWMSFLKKRRAAARVSEKPKPSAPREANSFGQELPDLVRHGLHVVGDRHDRAGGAGELLGDERDRGRARRG